MNSSYLDSLNFWNQVFTMDEDTKNAYKNEVDPENDWKELATSEKLMNVIIDKLSKQKKVLDYGCGDGWASIVLNKSGCVDVTGVDVVENAIDYANFIKELFNINEGLKFENVSLDWLSNTEADCYDGLFCSNVIDVVTEDVANNIIENIARVTTKDAKVVISMNYYSEPVADPEKNIEIKNGNEVYINGVLRMVARNDEEWTSIFSKYFKVEEITYFAWPGEEKETRRIFILYK